MASEASCQCDSNAVTRLERLQVQPEKHGSFLWREGSTTTVKFAVGHSQNVNTVIIRHEVGNIQCHDIVSTRV